MIDILALGVVMLWGHLHLLIKGKLMVSLNCLEQPRLVIPLNIGQEAEANLRHLLHQLRDDNRLV